MFHRLFDYIYRIADTHKKMKFKNAEDIRIFNQQPYLEEIYWDIVNGKNLSAYIEDENLSNEVKNILNYISSRDRSLNLEKNDDLSCAVIIPHYNHHKFLDDCLHLLSKQTVLPDEVIVVDDVSRNQEEVESICQKYSTSINLRLILSKEKLYCGRARQLGSEVSKSDILLMHDADDISHRQRIEFTKKTFHSFPEIVQVNIGYITLHNGFLDILKLFDKKELVNSYIDSKTIANVMKDVFVQEKFSAEKIYGYRYGAYGADADFFTHAGHVAYRREVVEKIKWSSPFDYVFTKWEDFDFNFLLFLMYNRTLQIDLPLAYYRIGSTTNKIHY